MRNDGTVIAEARSDKGMAQLAPTDFEPVLLDLIDNWLGSEPIEIIACGMVGSRQGWQEAPYQTVPCKPLADDLAVAPSNDPRVRMRIVPGLKQDNPADVMRGEETQIAGFLAEHSSFDGVLCLPGTHTKWVQISAGEIISFKTFMTGEIFDILATHSVLRHTVSEGWDQDAFLDAARDSLSKPELLAQRFFSLRASSLLDGAKPSESRSRLSGGLIGAELAASRPYWLGQNLAIIGERKLCDIYAAALSDQGVAPLIIDGSGITRAGLTAARQNQKELAS